MHRRIYSLFFFFNDTATTEIYTLSLHDALPISGDGAQPDGDVLLWRGRRPDVAGGNARPAHQPEPRRRGGPRSEEHTSELQSPCNLVCRLLLEKKKKKQNE